MASSASSATKRTSQRNARTKTISLLKKLEKPSTVTATLRTESITGGEVRAKRQTSSEVRVQRATPAAVKYDQHKPDYSLLTSAMLEPMTKALMYGEHKYSRGNFRKGFENIRLTSAALRHIFAYLDREEQDPESGVTHLGHAMAALAMLLDNIAEGVSTDVRYPKKEGD